MNREIIMVAACTVATIVFAWIIDHPDKRTGSVITLVIGGIIVGIAKARGESANHATKWRQRRRPPRPPTAQ